MIFNLYCIFDRKTGVFLAPFPARSDTDACRALYTDFANPEIRKTPIGTHPEDFDIVRVGMFSDTDGNLESMTHHHVTNVRDLINGGRDSTVPS